MTCKLCKEFRLKYPLQITEDESSHILENDLLSDPIRCAFENSNEFSIDNWCCQTMNELRKMAKDITRHNDSSLAVIPIRDGKDSQKGMLVLSWYKNKGRTSQAIVIDDSEITPFNLETAAHMVSS